MYFSHNSGFSRYSGQFAADGQIHYYERRLYILLLRIFLNPFDGIKNMHTYLYMIQNFLIKCTFYIIGKTKSVEWRIRQLKGLMKMYEENDSVFYEALDKDLRKPKWESMAAEVENNKNDIIGILRYSRLFSEPLSQAMLIFS